MPNNAIRTSLDELACNLERHMHANGMTPASLANASGLSRRTVANFLTPANRQSARGTSKSFPSGTIANLCKIAGALDVDAWVLLRPRVTAPTSTTAQARFHAAVEAAYAKRRKLEAPISRSR